MAINMALFFHTFLKCHAQKFLSEFCSSSITEQHSKQYLSWNILYIMISQVRLKGI